MVISLDIDFNEKAMIITNRLPTSDELCKLFSLIEDLDKWHIWFNFEKYDNEK